MENNILAESAEFKGEAVISITKQKIFHEKVLCKLNLQGNEYVVRKENKPRKKDEPPININYVHSTVKPNGHHPKCFLEEMELSGIPFDHALTLARENRGKIVCKSENDPRFILVIGTHDTKTNRGIFQCWQCQVFGYHIEHILTSF